MNDFKLVALMQRDRGIGGTGHDFLITLNRHLAGIKANGGQKRGHGGTLGHLAGFPVDGNGDGRHALNVAGRGRKGKRRPGLPGLDPPC